MKHTIFYSVAILSIGFLLYLNFFHGKKSEAMPSVISTDSAPKPIGPYSQAVARGNALFVSGQVAIDPKTSLPDTATIENETHRVMENVEAILSKAGLKMNDIVKTTIYMTDLKNFKAVNAIYASYFGDGPFPARETVQVAALPKGMHLEISVTAVK